MKQALALSLPSVNIITIFVVVMMMVFDIVICIQPTVLQRAGVYDAGSSASFE